MAIAVCNGKSKNPKVNIVFIGNSITYGALHKNRDVTAPPVQCGLWLSQQEGIDTVYISNGGRSGRTTYHFLPNANDVIPAGDKGPGERKRYRSEDIGCKINGVYRPLQSPFIGIYWFSAPQ